MGQYYLQGCEGWTEEERSSELLRISAEVVSQIKRIGEARSELTQHFAAYDDTFEGDLLDLGCGLRMGVMIIPPGVSPNDRPPIDDPSVVSFIGLMEDDDWQHDKIVYQARRVGTKRVLEIFIDGDWVKRFLSLE